MDINKTILVGKLDRNPNIGVTNNGKTVANLLVVTDDSYTNNEGTKIEKYEKHKIVAWGRQAEICKTLKKDDEVTIEGKNQTRKTETNNITEIVATVVLKK
jgi:single-strand DNA-binding protein